MQKATTMTDNPAPYRSNMAVSERVDRAWHRGYVEGQHAWKRIALVEFVAGLYVLLRRHRIPPLVWFFVADALLLALCVALVVLPILAMIWILRTAIRHHRASLPVARVTFDDGSVF